MKKRSFILLAATFLFASCQQTQTFIPYLDEVNGIPALHLDNSAHVTYLLLSPFGSIENYEGISTKGKVSDKFYENTVILTAESGTALPSSTQVVSSVSGVTFRGWAYYDEDNENVWPDYYSTVPATNGLALKAIFDGSASGGEDPADVITYNVTSFPNWLPNGGATVFSWAWGGDAGNGKWYKITLSYSGTTDGEYSNVTGTFNAPNNITGFNMARCTASTTTPSWTATGDSTGRIYNKTANVDISSGVTSYTSPEWVEYNP